MPTVKEIVYPVTDGKPMGENSLQVKWIHALMLGFERHFQTRPDVCVSADLFWYPVEGEPKIVTAPDVMIAFGRPKGERQSYKQWEEDDVAPQVVIEVLSPSNTPAARRKLAKFYEKYGVEEFYEYDPEARTLTVHLRSGDTLGPGRPAVSHTSSLLGVRFELPPGGELRITDMTGRPFPRYAELVGEATAHQEELIAARRRTDEERAKNERLAAKLRELGIDPDAL